MYKFTIYGDSGLIQKKVCLLGASSVGKTSLVKQFVEGIFNEKYLTTIGVKVDKKVVTIENEQVKLMLWDIEGNDRFHTFQERYLRGCAGYIIVVDRTRPSSLIEGLEINMKARQVTNCPAILAINKCDLDANWHWHDEELKSYQDLFDLEFNTSAKSGENVELMFLRLVELLLKD